MMRFILAGVVLVALQPAIIRAAEKPRLLVLTDMGADPDDQQSMVRLLVYANEFEIEGLIATSAGTTGKREQHATHPEMIRELVEAYGQVRANLLKHAAGYPTADELLGKVKIGSSERGMEAIGEGRDTEGSQWIISVVDKADVRPVCVSIWGGQTDLAQALWRVKHDRGDEGMKRFVSRLRIYDVADQDGLAYRIFLDFFEVPFRSQVGQQGSAGEKRLKPGFYIQSGAPPERDKREGLFRGMYLGGDESLVSREWMETNIRQNHGPLGALYPPKTWTAPNPHAAIKEGDTPSWLYFLPHGLNDSSHPTWGGFGGRFIPDKLGLYHDATDTVRGSALLSSGDKPIKEDARATVWRWRSAVQADFQARLNWCVADAFGKANHAPVVMLNGDGSRDVVPIQARAGELVELSAAASDPDGNAVRYRWFIYPEPSVMVDEVRLTSAEGTSTGLTMPRSASASVHVVLQARDDGLPPLSVFRRAVISAGGSR